MGRPLRFVPVPYAPVEVTIRTIMGMRFLKASDELNEVVVGVFARALELFDVLLYDLVVFGNHIQYTVGPRDAKTLSDFMCFLHGNIAKEVGRLVGWRGRFWSRRGKDIPIVDDEALEGRIRYLYEHGVKEGFVTSPLDWPGAASVKARMTGEPLRGTWFDRTAENRARRRGIDFGKYDYATRYELELSPAPCWEHLTEAEYREKVKQIVEQIEEEAAEAARDGKHFAGLEWLEAQDPLEIPERVKRSPAPLCHASTKANREAFKKDYLAFVTAFREAAADLVDGVLDAVFPEGSFPRPRPFVTPAAPLQVESLAPS